jgi:hypothetical protein
MFIIVKENTLKIWFLDISGISLRSFEYEAKY